MLHYYSNIYKYLLRKEVFITKVWSVIFGTCEDRQIVEVIIAMQCPHIKFCELFNDVRLSTIQRILIRQ